MRSLALALACGAALVVTNCASPSSNTNNTNAAASGNAAAATRATQTGTLPPVSSAHGGSSGGDSTGAPPASTTAGGNSAKPGGLDTAALDAKIEKAEAKAKAGGATQADKNAAAAALLERGNLYRDAGQPALYKFALGDYRRALRYQPGNGEAREKMEEIVSIYQGMGRPVPDNGNEP